MLREFSVHRLLDLILIISIVLLFLFISFVLGVSLYPIVDNYIPLVDLPDDGFGLVTSLISFGGIFLCFFIFVILVLYCIYDYIMPKVDIKEVCKK